MRITVLYIAITTVLLQFGSTAVAQNNQQRGATFGGLAGAVAGAIIGDNSNEAGAGAGIGAVVGAVAGGILGNASDKDNALQRQQQQYYYQQRAAQQQQQRVVLQQSTVNIGDVISMSRSGLSDSVIINQIQQRGYGSRLEVQDIIALHQQGVSENVIATLQGAPNPLQINAQPSIVRESVVVRQPVVVQQPVVRQHYVPTPVFVSPRIATPKYRPRPSRSRGGSGIQFRF